MDQHHKLRLKVCTNTGLNIMCTVNKDWTVEQLYPHITKLYKQVTEDQGRQNVNIQITTLKKNTFFIPKSQIVGQIFVDNEEVSCNVQTKLIKTENNMNKKQRMKLKKLVKQQQHQNQVKKEQEEQNNQQNDNKQANQDSKKNKHQVKQQNTQQQNKKSKNRNKNKKPKESENKPVFDSQKLMNIFQENKKKLQDNHHEQQQANPQNKQ